jgi:hypothetical protein
VYVNGLQIGSNESVQSVATASNNSSSLQRLFMAMSVWASGSAGVSGQGDGQVQIWNA